jgi:hypothetical protein
MFIKELIREHTAELVIFGITTAILAGITLLITGDISTVMAKGRH